MTLFSSVNQTTIFDVEFPSCRRIPKKRLNLFVGGNEPSWGPGWMWANVAVPQGIRKGAINYLRFHSVFDGSDPEFGSRCYMDIDPYSPAVVDGQPARYNTFSDHKRTILERDLIPAFPCRVEDVNTRCPANVSHMLTDVYGKEWWRPPYTHYDMKKGRWENDPQEAAAWGAV